MRQIFCDAFVLRQANLFQQLKSPSVGLNCDAAEIAKAVVREINLLNISSNQ